MIGTFRVTPRAQEDLIEIGRYTLARWGKKKRDSYLHDLDKSDGFCNLFYRSLKKTMLSI